MTNPYAPPQAPVGDVPPAGTTEPAERLSRLGASVLDGVIGMVIAFVPLAAGLVIIRVGPSVPGTIVAGALVAASGFVVWGWLTYVNVKRSGQTLGKKLVGIRVIRTDGSAASVGRIFWLRNVVNGLIGAIPLVGAIYSIVDILFIFSESRQCLHDRLADTIVVDA